MMLLRCALAFEKKALWTVCFAAVMLSLDFDSRARKPY
jgi:hypothetical protein